MMQKNVKKNYIYEECILLSMTGSFIHKFNSVVLLSPIY